MAENKQQQEIKEISEKLEQGVKELYESERYKEFLHTMSKFHNYSLNNTMVRRVSGYLPLHPIRKKRKETRLIRLQISLYWMKIMIRSRKW